MATILGDAVIRVRYDTPRGGLDRQLGDPGRAGRRFGDRFGRGMSAGIGESAKKAALGVGAAFAAVGVGSFFKDAITGASDLGETVSKVRQIFGPAAADVEKFAKGSATALGQTQQAALDANATFGIFAKSAGLTGRELSGFTTRFTTLASDLASFNNTTPEEAIEAIGAALRGESEPIRRYGVLLDDASLRQEALAQGLVKTTKDALTPQQKVLAASALIFKQTGDAQGDFARTSGGLANQQRILTAEFEGLKTTVGNALLPTVTQFVTFLNGKALPAVKGVYKALFQGDYDGSLFHRIGLEEDSPFVLGLFKVRDLAADVRDRFRQFLPVLREYGPAFAAGAVGVLATVKAVGLLTAAVRVLTLALAASGVGLAAIAVGALAVAFVKGYRESDGFRAWVDTKLKPALAGVGEFITGRVLPALGGLVDRFRRDALPAIRGVADFLRAKFTPAFDAIVTVWRRDLSPAFDQLKTALVENQDEFRAAQEFIGKVVAAALALWVELNARLIPVLVNVAGPVLGGVIRALSEGINTVGSFIGALPGFRDAVYKATLTVASYFLDMAGRILDAAERGLSWLPGIGDKITAANKQFKRFREAVNAELSQIKNREVLVKAGLAFDDSVQSSRMADQARARAAAVVRRANGGMVWGPGTGTSDSIPARLSNGEFVVRASQTAKHRELLEAINSGARGFATGGYVGRGGVTLGTDFPDGAQLAAFAGRINKSLDKVAASFGKAVQASLPKAAPGGSAAVGAGGFAFPVPRGSYRVSSGFGPRGGGFHGGVDFAAPTGTPVYAPFSGMMTALNLGGRSYGRYADIRAGSLRSIQAHLSAFARGNGRVAAGELVGRVGSTGNSTGPHLHQEFRVNGRSVNPRNYLTYDRGGVATGVGLLPKATPKPERVLSPEQTQAFERLVTLLERGGVGGGGVTYNGPIYTYDHEDLMRRQQRAQDFAAARARLAATR